MSDKTILLVDDEVNVLNSLKRLLRKEPYKILSATSGQEGLDVLNENSVQLIVSDYRMPEMSGIDFLQKVKELYPDTFRIILSGYAEIQIVLESINKGEVTRFLTKPWRDDEIKLIITQCLEQYDVLQQNKRLAEELKEKNLELKCLNARLKTTVQSQSDSLHYAQDVLESLPIPILVSDQNNNIVMVNMALQKTLPDPSDNIIGKAVQTVLTEDIANAVKQSLSGDCLPQVNTYQWYDKHVNLKLGPLFSEGNSKGCILAFD